MRKALVAGALALAVALPATAQVDTAKALQEYRDAFKDGNPAELWEVKGEDLWKQPRGPKKTSLERCDLGMGPGVLKGAYAHLPRYFKDADAVQDLESRLVYCMGTLQGISRADATRRVFGGPGAPADMEALVAYVTAQSRGVKMDVPMSHPKERETYALGEKLFFYRSGPHDFACSTCHGDEAKRIRLQDLPNLTTKRDAQRAYTTWPAYRVSQGELRSMQWRLNDCFRQQRFPELVFGSDVSVALTSFLARNSNGGTYDGPAVKR
jgi:L-cysteine S-thiosulfotransferase